MGDDNIPKRISRTFVTRSTYLKMFFNQMRSLLMNNIITFISNTVIQPFSISLKFTFSQTLLL